MKQIYSSMDINHSLTFWSNLFAMFTCLREQFCSFQNLLSVNTSFVVLHFSIDDVYDSSCPAPDGPRSPVQSVHIPLLEGNHTFVHVLQDVIFWGGWGGGNTYTFI